MAPRDGASAAMKDNLATGPPNANFWPEKVSTTLRDKSLCVLTNSLGTLSSQGQCYPRSSIISMEFGITRYISI